MNGEVRETEQRKADMNKHSIRFCDKYHENQVSRVLNNSLELSGGWGAGDERQPVTQRTFQSEGLACAKDLRMGRA